MKMFPIKPVSNVYMYRQNMQYAVPFLIELKPRKMQRLMIVTESVVPSILFA
uniref:Uncharacterized protein n=1 Tax=Triticum urartu TaxID=4572 RepID=A0A8R7TGL3_TRIUA